MGLTIFTRALAAASACVALAGCGGRGLNLVPVEGVVTLDGAPVENAGVLFAPVGAGPPASGTTDAAGRFTLMTANEEGAAVGQHRVAISKADAFGEEIPPVQLEDPDFARRRGLRAYRAKHFIPERYGDLEASGLTANVVESGDNRFEFTLSSNPR
ncbi:MAG: hypothetical protein DCC67_00195 [Planctomycetota bacterium]|nr:MAG: hypothetical protein DCC67_00195 [Planctomycetota bacterium]